MSLRRTLLRIVIIQTGFAFFFDEWLRCVAKRIFAVTNHLLQFSLLNKSQEPKTIN